MQSLDTSLTPTKRPSSTRTRPSLKCSSSTCSRLRRSSTRLISGRFVTERVCSRASRRTGALLQSLRSVKVLFPGPQGFCVRRSSGCRAGAQSEVLYANGYYKTGTVWQLRSLASSLLLSATCFTASQSNAFLFASVPVSRACRGATFHLLRTRHEKRYSHSLVNGTLPVNETGRRSSVIPPFPFNLFAQ